jgi:hypothetical protein
VLLYLFHSDLKERFRANAAYQMGKMATREHACRQGWVFLLILFCIQHVYILCLVKVKPLKEAPPLPQIEGLHLASKSIKAEMEEFLDDLLP